MPIVRLPLSNVDRVVKISLNQRRFCSCCLQFQLLEPSFPNIEMLQIGFNMLTELGQSDDSTPVANQKVKGFAKLEDLHLEGNLFSDWNQILRLSHLPR